MADNMLAINNNNCNSMANDDQNPWLNISWDNTIAECDRDFPIMLRKQEFLFGSEDYIKAVNVSDEDNIKKNKKKVGLRFDCLPEPFYGDPESQVYLLGMNPGEPDPDFIMDNDYHNRKYEDNCKAMLRHDLRYLNNPGLLYDSINHTIIYNPDEYNNIINDIFDNNRIKEFRDKIEQFPIRPHVGDIWQWEMWKQLREKKGRNPKVFSIEFFPYHSTSGFAFPTDLPSYKYRNKLIQDGMKEEKLFIIMRNDKMWYDIKFEGKWKSLKDYPHKVFLRNKQRIWLTSGNFVKEIPEKKSDVADYEENWVCKSIEDIIKKFYPDSE